jgi:hypothetical protein
MSQPITRIDHPLRTDRVGGVTPLLPGDVRHGRRSPADEVSAHPAEQFDGLPAAPPPEVMEEVAAASHRLDALRAERVSLRFEVPDDGRVRITVVGEDGEVRRRIPATEAIEIAAGERPALPPERAPAPDEHAHIDLEA